MFLFFGFPFLLLSPLDLLAEVPHFGIDFISSGY